MGFRVREFRSKAVGSPSETPVGEAHDASREP